MAGGSSSAQVARWAVVFLIATGILLFSSGFLGRFEHHKVVLERASGNFNQAALSPDGTRIALSRSDETFKFQSTDIETATTVELRDVASSSLVRSVTFPSISFSETASFWSEAGNSLSFCDDGKLLLVPVQQGQFRVVDSTTLKPLQTINLQDPALSAVRIQGASTAVAAACAAHGTTAVFEAFDGARRKDAPGVLKIMDLLTGQELGDFPNDATKGWLRGVGISASGKRAFVVIQHLVDDLSDGTADVTLFDLQSHTVSLRLNTGDGSACVAFAGEDAIATLSSPTKRNSPQIDIRSVQDGRILRSFSDPKHAAGTMLGASADGRVLMAYTGSEDRGEVHGEPTLHIHTARFTLWDTRTGALLGRSPSLTFHKRSAESGNPLFLIGLGPWTSDRPYLEIDQNGTAVLSADTVWSGPFDVYTLRPWWIKAFSPRS